MGGDINWYWNLLEDSIFLNDLKIWTENNDESHSHTRQYFHDGAQDHVIQSKCRNAVAQDHTTKLFSGIGTFAHCTFCDVYVLFHLFD